MNRQRRRAFRSYNNGDIRSSFWVDEESHFTTWTNEDWVWTVAFADVLKLRNTQSFYSQLKPSERKAKREHYLELATHDTSKGRKAAKVIAYVMALRMKGIQV